MSALTLYPGGGYKSQTIVTTTDMAGTATDSAMQILGTNNVLQKEQSLNLATDAQLAGGDLVETLSTNIKTGADLVLGHKVGDNSDLYIAQLDDNTKAILDQAFTVVGANANNMMSLSAGRNPDIGLSDDSVEIAATGDAIAAAAPAVSAAARQLGLLIILIFAGWFFIFERKRKGR